MLHRGLPALHGLPGQAIDQVQRQVGELRLPGRLHRLVGLLGGVDAVDGAQLPLLGGLHPHGQAVHPRLAQNAQGLQVHAVRVALHGDLRVLLHLKQLGQVGEQLLDALGPVVAGGAAAEVDGVHRDSPGPGERSPADGPAGPSDTGPSGPPAPPGSRSHSSRIYCGRREYGCKYPACPPWRHTSTKKFHRIISHPERERKRRNAGRPVFPDDNRLFFCYNAPCKPALVRPGTI